jgi:hypothetical protein
MAGDFYPVEEVMDEEGAKQSIECHVKNHDERHRSAIRLFFPELGVITQDELTQLEQWSMLTGGRGRDVIDLLPKDAWGEVIVSDANLRTK